MSINKMMGLMFLLLVLASALLTVSLKSCGREFRDMIRATCIEYGELHNVETKYTEHNGCYMRVNNKWVKVNI